MAAASQRCDATNLAHDEHQTAPAREYRHRNLPFLLAIYFGVLPISCLLFGQIFFGTWVYIFIVQCMVVVAAVFHAFTISSTHCTALMDELS